METKEIIGLFREGKFKEIVEKYAILEIEQFQDSRAVFQIAESCRKMQDWKQCIKWTEWLIQLKPEARYLVKLKELYMQENASQKQWENLMEISQDKSEEIYVISKYFSAKRRGADIETLKVLCKKMMSEISYDDDIYFEAAEFYEKAGETDEQRYYLEQIQKSSHDEVYLRKVQKLLQKQNSLEKKEPFIETSVQRIERKVPASIQKYFTDVIGMENIKEELGALYYYLQPGERKDEKIAVPYNFIIAGQSGSGKTKLAKIIVKMLYEEGLIEDEEAIEINALSIVEDPSILEEAQVIIINNAEHMSNPSDGEGRENGESKIWLAIEPLLESACAERTHFYLFLGEAEAMDKLMTSNPKLEKYLTYLKIPVYSVKELHQMGLQMIERDNYEISEEGKEQFYQQIRRKSVLGNFANGHSIYNLIIEAKKNLSYRTAAQGKVKSFDAVDFMMQEEAEETLEELLNKLNSLTGLTVVKKEVEEKIATFNMLEKNRKSGCGNEETITLNTLLLGPPGTGKTTVARLLGKIYGQIGILPRGDIFVEVTRDGLVAGYTGQTALKVDEIVKKAMGGVLFIDEAYNLVNGDHDEFGKEAFNTLLTRAENYRDRLMIIMAGYEEPMRELLAVNEGMARRFPHELHFENYTEEELYTIFQSMMIQRGYHLHMNAENAVRRLIKSKMSRNNFGNAGDIRNMLEGIIQKLSVRVFNQKIESHIDRMTIRRNDVEEYIGHSTEIEKTLEDYLEELNRLTGLESVKNHIMEELKSSRIAQERARRAGVDYSPGTLHMLLVGNAGTGKTTVARLIGKIYGKAGLIKNDDVFVEIRRESLVAGYMGQTGAKVIKEVDKAKGGVLFIDEAYNLVNGEHDEFGKDALNTLLAPIENNRDDLMVIMAGYEPEMDDLLNHNQGLRSRLNTKLVLEDYSLEQMVHIFYKKAETEGYLIENGIKDYVSEYLAAEKKKAYPDFGNARGVRNCFESVVKRMNARLSSCENTFLSDRKLQSLSDEEIRTIRKIDFEVR